jgi:hypothetical protein
MSPLEQLVYGYNHVVLAYFALMNLMYLVLLYHAGRAMLDRVQRGRMEAIDDLLRSPLAPGVTVIVPAYNEQECIVESVRSLLARWSPGWSGSSRSRRFRGCTCPTSRPPPCVASCARATSRACWWRRR